MLNEPEKKLMSHKDGYRDLWALGFYLFLRTTSFAQRIFALLAESAKWFCILPMEHYYGYNGKKRCSGSTE